MHRLEFKYGINYRGYVGHEGNYPVVTIRLASEHGTADVPTIIDTGTELTIVSAQYALALGLDLQSGRRKTFSPTRGAGLLTWGHKLRVRIFDEVFENEIFFSEEAISRCLLGRDILAKTQLGLREYHGQLFLFENSYSSS